jgi:hypothetical protein
MECRDEGWIERERMMEKMKMKMKSLWMVDKKKKKLRPGCDDDSVMRVGLAATQVGLRG